MLSETVAILIDGGFYQYRAKTLWGPKTAKERANELEQYCQQHLRFTRNHDTEYDRLYRTFYSVILNKKQG